jgi:hypothetical protein
MKNIFKVVVPDLDMVIDEFNTMQEAVKFVDECIEWDKNNPQGYVPYYKIEKEVQ